MGKQNKSQKKTISSKKTQLPFILHRAPLQNRILYEKKGHWTQKEKLKYVIFLEYFKSKFTTRDKKKRYCRIFKLMADFIKTRTHNQCRSHHQKMEKQRFQVDDIIKNVVSKYHPRVFNSLFERYQKEIQNLDFSDSFVQNLKCSTLKKIRITHQSKQKKDQAQNPKPKEIQIEEKNVSQEAGKNSFASFLNENVQENQNQESFINPKIKQPRITRSSESDQEDLLLDNERVILNYPNQNCHLVKGQQSLDCRFSNNLEILNTFQGGFPPLKSSDFLQNIELKKIYFMNRANFHYTQMQIELNNVAECERQKQAFIQNQMQLNKRQNSLHFQIQNLPWSYSQFNNLS